MKQEIQRKKWDEKYRETHRERVRKQQRAWYRRNIEKEKERSRMKHQKQMMENPEKVRGYYRKYSKTAKGKYQAYKKNAKNRGIKFDITIEQFVEIILKPCHWCGRSGVYMGIDRLVNRYGYSLKNCRPCCSMCNHMKRDWSPDQFILQIKRIQRHWDGRDEYMSKV
jgi:hypothetical protein